MKIVKLLVILSNLYLTSGHAIGHRWDDNTLKSLRKNLWEQGPYSEFTPYVPEVFLYIPESDSHDKQDKDYIPELKFALDMPD
jgi:hypothetical protein